MDEELEKLEVSETSIETQISEPKVEQSTAPANFLNLEEMKKSEKEVRTAHKIQGVAEIDANIENENREFAKKSDAKKAFAKKRLKVITGVYVSVVGMLLALVGVNIFTLAAMDSTILDNGKSIITAQKEIETVIEGVTEDVLSGLPIEISLNEPRDYSEDKKGLTFFDKMSIVFRNLFG